LNTNDVNKTKFLIPRPK